MQTKMIVPSLLAALCLVCAVAASARDVYVHGYTKANGTYVQPYHRTSPNSTKLDNYSTIGNVNPYTGKSGTVNPYVTPTYQSTYQSTYQQPTNSTPPDQQQQQDGGDNDGWR